MCAGGSAAQRYAEPQSTRIVERQVTCYRLDLPGGNDITSAVTSPATAAARRPQSAPGIPSTVPVSSPAARDASPEDERRSAAGRSPIAVPDFQIHRGPTTLRSAGRTSSLREAFGP